MIRAGTEDDYDAITSMAEEFWQYTIYDEKFCPDTVRAMTALCDEQGLLSVLQVGGKVVGFACGVKGPLLANSEVLSGTEIAWWVDPAHRSGRNGIALLKHIERLAKKAGIKYWNMAYMESSMPEEIKSIYERMGYKRSEVIYTRIL